MSMYAQPSYLTINFDQIVNGALGSTESNAAKRWVDAGQKVMKRPASLITKDGATGYDTRVVLIDEDDELPVALHRKRKASDDGQAGRVRAKQRIQPAPLPNEYSRAAFVGHSDAVGTMARRKARGQLPTEQDEEFLRQRDLRNIPLPPVPTGWTARIAPYKGGYNKVFTYEKTGERYRSHAAAKAHWENLGHSVPHNAPPANLPKRWLVLPPETQEEINGPPEIEPYPELYVSPEGLIVNYCGEAQTVAEATTQNLQSSFPNMSSWLKNLVRTDRAVFPRLDEPDAASMALALQRLRVARFEDEKRQALLRMKGKAVTRKPTDKKSAEALALRRQQLREQTKNKKK